MDSAVFVISFYPHPVIILPLFLLTLHTSCNSKWVSDPTVLHFPFSKSMGEKKVYLPKWGCINSGWCFVIDGLNQKINSSGKIHSTWRMQPLRVVNLVILWICCIPVRGKNNFHASNSVLYLWFCATWEQKVAVMKNEVKLHLSRIGSVCCRSNRLLQQADNSIMFPVPHTVSFFHSVSGDMLHFSCPWNFVLKSAKQINEYTRLHLDTRDTSGPRFHHCTIKAAGSIGECNMWMVNRLRMEIRSRGILRRAPAPA